MSTDTAFESREERLEWQDKQARELALIKQRITVLEEENEKLRATVNALKRRIASLDPDIESDWP